MASSKAQSTISVDTCLSGIKEKQGNASFTYFSPTLNKVRCFTKIHFDLKHAVIIHAGKMFLV